MSTIYKQILKMINVITTFSGYDSQCLALRKAGIDFNLVAWAEFDPQSKQPLEKQPAVIAHNLLFPEDFLILIYDKG